MLQSLRPMLALGSLALVGMAAAQVPRGYLVVSEAAPLPEPALHYVEPSTGLAIAVRPAPGVTAGTTETVSVDPTNPNLLYTAPFPYMASWTYIHTATLQGSRYTNLQRASAQGPVGHPVRFKALNSEMLFTIALPVGGAFIGSFNLSSSTMVANLPQAADIAVIGSLGYVNSYLAGFQSTLVEIDLVTRQSRTITTNAPPIRSLGVVNGTQLIGGTETGDILTIDVATGATTTLVSTTLGGILAIVEDPASGLPYFGTDRNEIYFLPNITQPVYRTTHPLLDFDFGIHDLPAHLQYGDGCPGSNALVPHFTYVNTPALGTGNYTLEVVDGLAGGGVFLAAGFSRQMLFTGQALPLQLSVLVPGVAPSCELLTDVAATNFQLLDGSGSARVVLPIPNVTSLAGLHVMWQWAHLDLAAPGSVVMSDGIESVLR